ncbi:MAG: Glu/Leu/Phe/Val dehydrogenase [Dehalococcoidia bacterium]|nr:Glu/Leu/Phe/Val dehydrogenase [Dehalococcoidia bacterium]MYI86375.1 Glu/Leu/Phe/Val dehydrogenase [Dehalococcoidia bacterium]
MKVFGEPEQGGHERVLFAQDCESGLRAIIAVHSTVLGPALGGTRFYPYDCEEDALADVLRLSRAMTRKNAAAGLDHGGGKGVIIGDPRTLKSERLLRAYGRAIESLGGGYVTAEDVGTTIADMEVIGRETRHVTGTARDMGGSGDPSPTTALGLVAAMRGTSRFLWDSSDLSGRHVAIQGVGKVGGAFARMLGALGARLTIADVNEKAVQALAGELGADIADPAAVHAVECDVFAPCALGGALNPETVPELRCAAVVGSANNQLADDALATDLAARGILYVPDFIVNAGGVINLAEEVGREYQIERANRRVHAIEGTVTDLLARARETGATPLDEAIALAERRIREVGGLPAPVGH